MNRHLANARLHTNFSRRTHLSTQTHLDTHTQDTIRHAPVLLPPGAAVLYGVMSVSATVLTKAVISTYGFSNIVFMMTVERMMMTVWILASGSWSLNAVAGSCRRLWPLTIVSCLNTFVAVSSLSGLNIPMYNALKRLTSLVTLLMEALVLQKFSSLPAVMSVVMIAVGALGAAAQDLDYHFSSYCYALASCCLNALNLTLIKRECLMQRSAFALGDIAEISLVNNLVPLPLLLLYLEISGERQVVLAYEGWADYSFWGALLCSSVAGCCLGFSQGLCTKHSSAVTTTIVGQMKMVISTYLGIVFFDVRISAVQAVGLVLNTVGGCLFAYLKQREHATSQDARERKEARAD